MIAQIYDAQDGNAQVGYGLEYCRPAEAEKRRRTLHRLNRAEGRLLVDWIHPSGRLAESFHITEAGYQEFTGLPFRAAEAA